MVTTGDANRRFKKPNEPGELETSTKWMECVLPEFSDVKKYATCVKKNTIVIYM